MLEKLKKHWNVNGWNLLLILVTFALGGSLCGWAGRKLLLLTSLDKGVLWFVAYILLVSLLWPVAVFLVSIPLGQHRFFKKYLSRVWNKMSGKKKKGIAVFASGAGTNAAKIISHFNDNKGSKHAEVRLVASNNPSATVLKLAEEKNIDTLILDKERFFNGDACVQDIKKKIST